MSKSKQEFMNQRDRERYEDDRHLDDGYYFDILQKMHHADQESNPNKKQHGTQESNTQTS